MKIFATRRRRTVAGEIGGSILVVLLAAAPLAAGPFTEPGISSSEVAHWAAEVVDGSYRPALAVGPEFADPTAALGPVDSQIVALGELNQAAIDSGMTPGTITLSFAAPLTNGPGWDLAVFENGFEFASGSLFAELAYVEVSSDGTNFARFPSTSLTTERDEEFGSAFAGIDPTDVFQLAGKFPGGLGAPFDLQNLIDHPLVQNATVDLSRIGYVRLIDIPGSASLDEPLRNAAGEALATDAEGRVILDAWDTSVDSFRDPPIAVNGGFDLDAVGARYLAPEPAVGVLLAASLSIWLGGRGGRAMLR